MRPPTSVDWSTTTAHLLAGSFACLALSGAAMWLALAATDVGEGVTLFTALTLLWVLPVGVLGWRWGGRSVLKGQVGLPVTVALCVSLLPLALAWSIGRHASLAGAVVWIPGLGLALSAAAWLARSARAPLAWIAGIVLWLATLQLTLLVLSDVLLTLPTALTDRLQLIDEWQAIVGVPQLGLLVGTYAIAYVIATARRRDLS